MEELEVRRSLIGRLYERKRRNYRDPTRFTKCQTIETRLATIKQTVNAIPLHKRIHTNGKFKKCWLERRLLGWKLQVYKADRETLPPEMSLMRLRMELTDRPGWKETGEERAERKRQQIEDLLYLSLCTRSLEEIQRLVDADDQ